MSPSKETQPSQFLLLRNCLCAGAAAATATGFFNPLDTLRVRWQMSPQLTTGRAVGTAAVAAHAHSNSVLNYARSIITTEGLINGLWRPGVVATMLSMGTSAGLRIGAYPFLRDRVTGDPKKKTPLVMFATGLVAGAGGYWVASPIFQAKTRLQAATLLRDAGSTSRSVIAQLHAVWSEGGVPALWRGASPLVIRGALFSAGQTLGYDGTKTLLAQKHKIMQDGPVLHVVASAVAALFAATFSAPADFVMVRYQSGFQMGGFYSGPLACLQAILKEEGPQALFRGWVPSFTRIGPMFLAFHLLYEQFRALAGLNYLT